MSMSNKPSFAHGKTKGKTKSKPSEPKADSVGGDGSGPAADPPPAPEFVATEAMKKEAVQNAKIAVAEAEGISVDDRVLWRRPGKSFRRNFSRFSRTRNSIKLS
jgi:hypothetical protein